MTCREVIEFLGAWLDGELDGPRRARRSRATWRSARRASRTSRPTGARSSSPAPPGSRTSRSRRCRKSSSPPSSPRGRSNYPGKQGQARITRGACAVPATSRKWCLSPFIGRGGRDEAGAATIRRVPTAPVIVDIRTVEELAAAVATWRRSPAVALDTEFVRERTFYARLGLVQVAIGDDTWLVDPLTVGDLSPLGELLRDPAVVKVIHSASGDVDLLVRLLGASPQPLFDTQIAAAVAGLGTGLSLQKLLATVLGVELPKNETRTDWLARPLSDAQRLYAAEDVQHLVPLHDRLRAELAGLGRLDWALEDAATLAGRDRSPEDPEDAWMRVKGAGRLGRRQLGALQLLAGWRELEARRRDLPRSFVLRDDTLVQLAARMPEQRQDLHRLPGVDPRQLGRDGATWIELLDEARALPEAALPEPRPGIPFAGWVKDLDKKLRAIVAEEATRLGIPAEVLASRRGLEQLIRWGPEPPPEETPRELRGWRGAILADRLREAARQGRPDLLW